MRIRVVTLNAKKATIYAVLVNLVREMTAKERSLHHKKPFILKRRNHLSKIGKTKNKVDGLIGSSSFSIRCCPVTEELNFSNPTECKWFGGASGDYVSCINGMASFGRCSTSGEVLTQI